jgi:hypothetical protein
MSLGPGQLDLRDSFVEYYRGVNIYGHADTPGLYFFWGATLYDGLVNEIAAENKIDELSLAGVGAANPVDVAPPVSGLELLETYRGVPIYRGRYSYMGGGVHLFEFFYYKGVYYSNDPHDVTALPTVHAKIDELLAAEVYVPPAQPPYTPPTDGGLNPPPDGGDSLFGQIVAAIQAWLAPLLTPLQNAWNDFWWYTWPEWTIAFTKLGASWDEFKSQTWVSLTTSFSNLKANWDTFWTKTYPDMLAKSKAKEDELAARLEASRAEAKAGTLEGDATTRSWVTTGFLGWLSAAIGKVPPTMFSGIFGTLSTSWAQGAVESFWRGLDEGLTE